MKKIFGLILTVSLIVISLSGAFASDPGLFAELGRDEGADERLAALDQAAEKLSVSSGSNGSFIEVSQAYFEGDRVYISYRASGCQVVQDGLDLEDGSYADIIAGEETGLDDGSVIGWKECIVPDDGSPEVHTFRLVYRNSGSDEKKELNFTLKRHDYDQYLQGVSPAEACPAEAFLYMGKVDLKGTVLISSPEQAAGWIAWLEGEEETGTDVIVFWNLYQNGELVSPDLFGASEALEDGVVFSVMFPRMEDLSGLTLVPEYSEAGEKPEEAIVLSLTSPES